MIKQFNLIQNNFVIILKKLFLFQLYLGSALEKIFNYE